MPDLALGLWLSLLLSKTYSLEGGCLQDMKLLGFNLYIRAASFLAIH